MYFFSCETPNIVDLVADYVYLQSYNQRWNETVRMDCLSEGSPENIEIEMFAFIAASIEIEYIQHFLSWYELFYPTPVKYFSQLNLKIFRNHL